MRLAISVEGQTEDEFSRRLLADYFLAHGVYVHSVILSTKTAVSGEKYKGGGANLDRAAREVQRLIHDFDFVTTLYDFYGFGGKQPGQTVDDLQRELHQRVKNAENFHPYFQRHEFEALLFSDASQIAVAMGRPNSVVDLEAIRRQFASPEDINDSPITAPSKRIEAVFAGYNKRVHGLLIAERIGLPTIRQACPRFNGWLETIEARATRGK